MERNISSPFLKAVDNGDVEAVKALLDMSNSRNEIIYLRPDEQTCQSVRLQNSLAVEVPPKFCISEADWLEALWMATQKGDGVVEDILHRNPVIEEANENGWTIIHKKVDDFIRRASDPKEFEKVQILLKSGKFDVNCLTGRQETVLHLIFVPSYLSFIRYATDSLFELLKFLYENGVNVNHRNHQGKTVLMLACELRESEAVQMLFSCRKHSKTSFNVDVVDNFGNTAMMIAQRNKDNESASLIFNESLVMAAENNDLKTLDKYVRMSCKESEPVTRTWLSYETTITASIWEIYISNAAWFQAVSKAAEERNAHVLNCLLDCERLVQYQESGESSPMWFALEQQRKEEKIIDVQFIKTLLESECFSPNDLSQISQTLLHFSFSEYWSTDALFCSGDHRTENLNSVILTLLRCNVNPNQQDFEGKTVLMISSLKGCNSVVRTILTWAIETRTWLDIDARDLYGQTALMKAAMGKHPDVVAMLLGAGASVNLSDNRAFTALHHALHETLNVVEWGAFGEPPKRVTFEPSSGFYGRNQEQLNRDKLKVVELLLKRADLDEGAMDCEGYTPIHIALMYGGDVYTFVIDTLKQDGKGFNISENNCLLEDISHRFECNSDSELESNMSRRSVHRPSPGDRLSFNLGPSGRIRPIKQLDFLAEQKGGDRAISGQLCSIGFRFERTDTDRKNPSQLTEDLWMQYKYACRNPMTSKILEEVKDFMRDLCVEIKRQDRRFEVVVKLVGSAYEGTKIDHPDEYDFNLVLMKFSELCEVQTSPELPPGYVRLRKRQLLVEKEKETGFESFFSDNGILNTGKVKGHFKTILWRALVDSQFIKRQKNFEWRVAPRFPYEQYPLETDLGTTVVLQRTKYDIGDTNASEYISLDIVPCIHVDNWWPDEAISNVADDIKAFGCKLVFDLPQRKYPWVPYSGSCARISFAPAESETIKRSSIAAKAAFMIAKQMTQKQPRYDYIGSTAYVLKTCFLYCIEAFEKESRFSVNSTTNFHDYSPDIQFWLQMIMKCHLYFYLHDFCPCYFMPSFFVPNATYMRENTVKLLTDSRKLRLFEVYVCVHALYRSVSTDESIIRVQIPTLNPVWETFDRRTFMTDLRADLQSMHSL